MNFTWHRLHRLHALDSSANPYPKSLKRLKALIRYLDRQIKAIERDIQEMVLSDEWLSNKVEQVISIPGVGLLMAYRNKN